MQEVTCFHCNNVVEIAPDQSLCSFCGEDLQHLLAPEAVADYFHRRARTLAAAGEGASALVEVERGLTYAASAELHLLAAILAQQVGRFDRMRHHVAAIAVDDSLRPEAEWLLRAHQARQAALRAEAGAKGSALLRPAGGAAAAFLDELLGREQAAGRAVSAARLAALRPALPVMALVGLMIAAYLWLGTDGSRSGAGTAPAEAQPAPAESQAEIVPAAAAPEAAGLTLLPTPTPTPDVPPDVVQAPAAEVATAGLRPVVIIAATPFDLRQFLSDAGYPDLAALDVKATRQGDKLVLQGIVTLDRQRRELIELARTVEGISEVSAVNLLLRPLPSYTVQEGDTLWTIAYTIYGDDPGRIDTLFDINRDLLPSPDALAPGMVLQVPPLQ
jgi:nucleoid-associated protein YgaU